MKTLVRVVCFALAASCAPAMAASLTTAPFGTTRDGKAVTITTMTARDGLTVRFISYGGRITQILAPDRQGHLADIVLGYPTLAQYEAALPTGGPFFGALIGRYANRIAKGRFTLDGHTYTLPINNSPNSLHGGAHGFDKQVWAVQPLVVSGPSVSAVLRLTSPDGEAGYPGTLNVAVTYTLDDSGVFRIDYRATTNKDTVLNLTNHSYFNLAGVGAPDGVENEMLTIDADRYTPTDATGIPTGLLAPVAGTPFDFRTPHMIGSRIRDDDQQLLWAHGYDHNWVLNKSGDPTVPQLAATVYDPASGRTLECLTTQPGIQVYTGNALAGQFAGYGGLYRQTDAVTLETQHFPNSPNDPDFPTTELKPGQVFRGTTIFRFGVRR
jgi:aldose 1-epimerase